jgi:hypothetical protein
LRQLDWRFLLPAPPEGGFSHLVLLGASTDLLEHVLAIKLAKHVSQKLREGRMADAIIALNGAGVSLNEISNHLEPSGVVYYEFEQSYPGALLGTPQRLVRSLQRMNLSLTGLYWIRPDFAHCQMYLPLHVPGTLRWYLESSFIADTPAKYLLALVLRAFANWGGRVILPLARYSVITAVAQPLHTFVPSVLAHPMLPARLQLPALQLLLLTLGKDDLNRVVMFPFTADSDEPLAAIKLWRVGKQNAITQREQDTLAQLRTRLNEVTRQSIPEPLGTIEWEQLAVGIESCARGKSLTALSRQCGRSLHEKINDLNLVVNWLTKFNRQVQFSYAPWNDVEIKKWVERPLNEYQRAFGLTQNEDRLFECVRHRLKALRHIPLPMVWMHWGFSEPNLFRNADKIMVIDWEDDGGGPPLYDLLYFLLRWSCSVRKVYGDIAQLKHFHVLFCEPHCNKPVPVAVHQAISSYLTQLSIDQRFLPILQVLLWVERALGAFERRNESNSSEATNREHNEYVGYVSLLADCGEKFFDSSTKT